MPSPETATAGRPGVRIFLSANRIFFAATVALLLVTILCGGARIFRREAFAEGNAGPLLARLDFIFRQAADHAALVNAYAAYARRAKVDASRLLDSSERSVASFSSIAARLTKPDDSEDDALRAVEVELRDGAKPFKKLVLEWKDRFEAQGKIQKLYDIIFSVNLQLQRARKFDELSSRVAARSTPKSLHCLNMRLMEERVAHPGSYPGAIRDPDLTSDAASDSYHYAIFSDNVIAASVVVNSAARSAAEPSKHVFHLVTDWMHLAAFQVWFARRPPPGGARVEIRSDADLPFLNTSSPPPLEHLKFYLPGIFPRLKKIILLEDDVVVQRDMAALWRIDMRGKTNGAAEICFGPFGRYSKYLNFSHPAVRGKFAPRGCAWAHGVNLFDLDSWRRERLTERFQAYENLNSDGTLWARGSPAAAELMTFHGSTYPLDKAWNLMGLGRNPRITEAEIAGAGAVHFAGAMKPWLDVGIAQYKSLWTRHVDAEDDLLHLCNFGR